jgi:hypothetical protein
MKGFPNQVAELSKLAKAMQAIVRLTAAHEQAKDDGVFGEALVRAEVAGTGHTPMPVEQYLRIQRTKSKSNQSFRTTARGLRELFRLLGFIDDSGDDVFVTDSGRQAAGFADQPMNARQLEFWRRTVRNMTHAGTDDSESHPYQVLLRLVARKPGITRAKCALALEARDDSPAELDRITQLADLAETEIIRQLGITKPNWDNAKKVLPKFAEQLGDVIRDGDSYTIAVAPGRAAAGPAAPLAAAAGRRARVAIRAPRTSRQVTPTTIGRAATAENFDEFAAVREIDQATAAEGVRSRRNRLRRHNLLVQKLAGRLAAAGGQLFEDPFDVLALLANVGILGEVKTLDGTEADERDRVWEALAQLLYYQAFLLPPAASQASIRMVACFERRPTNNHIRWLNQQNIAVIWEDGRGFAGDALAANFLGRYLEELR